MTDYKDVFKNVALHYIKKGEHYKNNHDFELARYNYSKSIPYFCESALLEKIYGNIEESNILLETALNLKNEICIEQNDFSHSVFNYAEAIKFAFQDNYKECINKLDIAKCSLNKTDDEYDPLYHSWIFCENGFCYNKINEIDESQKNYMRGFVLLKSIELKNFYYKITRKYLQHAILSNPEEIYSDIVNDLNEIALSARAIKNYQLASIYFCEVAILQKIKGNFTECNGNLKNALGLIEKLEQNEDIFSKCIIFYINGVSHSLKSDPHDSNNKNIDYEIELKKAIYNFESSMKILKNTNIEHLIFSTFLNREHANCKHKHEESKNYLYFINANKLILELDWILTLHERTLGIYYNYLGVNQRKKLLDGTKLEEQFFIIENLQKICNEHDPKLCGIIERLNKSEWENIKIEMNNMKDPLFAFDKSLNYLADVNDEIVVAVTHMDISQIYVHKGNIYRAKLELEMALKYFSNIDNDFLKAQYHHASGIIMWKLRDLKGAAVEYSKALKFAKKSESERAQIVIYNNLIPILIELKDFKQSFDYCKNAIELLEKEKEKEIFQNRFILAKIYLNYSILNAIKYENYSISNEYLIKAKEVSETLKDSNLFSSIESVSNWIEQRQQGISP